MRYLDLDHLPDRPLRPQRPISKKKKWVKLGIITALVAGLGYGGYALFWPASATFGDIFKAPQAVLSFIKPAEDNLKSTDGRTNILILGTDYRVGMPAENLSDTMMIASIDTQSKNKDVVLVSIPRDLLVPLPAWKYGPNNQYNFYQQSTKINAANAYGDAYSYPEGGGLGLARNAVQNVTGIPIHYVVRVNFYGFKQIVDSIGGISVNIDNSFTDCEYPVEGQENNPVLSQRYKCVVFNKGTSYMDGETALEFSRSRHAAGLEGSDLARAKRQQKIMVAVRAKALTIQTLSDPLKVSNLIKSLGDNIKTLDVDFAQIGSFYHLIQNVQADSAQNIVLTDSPQYTTDPGSALLVTGDSSLYGGAFVFIPRAGDSHFQEIQTYLKRKLAEASLGQQATPSAQPSSP